MLNTCLSVFLVSSTVLIGLIIFSILSRLVHGIYIAISSWFADRHYSSEENDEDEYLVGKYDVSAFRDRIKDMMDEDGLYDIPEYLVREDKKGDFTGVEIVSNSAEIEIDKKVY